MRADRGMANAALLAVVCVLLAAAVAAWLVFATRDRGPAGDELAMTGSGEEQLATLAAGTEPGSADSSSSRGAGTSEGRGAGSTSATRPAGRAQALPRLVDLGAGTCVPCKMMAPILEEMKTTFAGELDVVVIDIRKDNTAAKRYGISVIPTQIFFDASGKELFRHQGFFSREDMLAKWKELGVELDG
jgi:thioredoxin 1